MNKKIFFWSLIGTTLNIQFIDSKVAAATWKVIAEAIAKQEGDGQTENLELAIQAYRNIDADLIAKSAIAANSLLATKYPNDIAKFKDDERYNKMSQDAIGAEVSKTIPTKYANLFKAAKVKVVPE